MKIMESGAEAPHSKTQAAINVLEVPEPRFAVRQSSAAFDDATKAREIVRGIGELHEPASTDLVRTCIDDH
ncbi:MAG TPA: hypothetical protein VFX07_06095 [Candidatus Udaeobacter sp.]|jgi:hypothetical protein|nr:hypothetical protein [Candidatus Udaeobacter sp.]